jgi:membrane-associated phospholipid phosphatase
VIRWDGTLFGCQPSLVFMQKLPFLAISEIFYAAYFSYYLMIGGVGLALYVRNRRQFFHYISVISFVFYCCYLIYIFVPVIGPPVFFRTIFNYSLPPQLQHLAASEPVPEAIKAGIFYQVMKWIYQVFEAPGAAIPSSHVAIALCTVSFSFRYLRAIRWFHMVMAVLLCLATIYCRYHYAADVLAGIATAVVLIPIADRLYFRCDGLTPSVAAAQNLAAPITRPSTAADPNAGSAHETVS